LSTCHNLSSYGTTTGPRPEEPKSWRKEAGSSLKIYSI